MEEAPEAFERISRDLTIYDLDEDGTVSVEHGVDFLTLHQDDSVVDLRSDFTLAGLTLTAPHVTIELTEEQLTNLKFVLNRAGVPHVPNSPGRSQ